MAAERRAVGERGGALAERLEDLVGGDHRPHRDVGAGQGLGGRDDVGLVAVALAAEVVAETAPRADHLVADQQDVVLVADLAHALEVALLRRDAAAGVLQRLEDHGRDRLGTVELDLVADLLGGPERVAVLGPVVLVRVRRVDPARHVGLELGLEAGQPGGGERAHGRAVVGDLAGDDLVLLALAVRPVVVAGDLDRGLDRLRAGVREEDPVQVAGGQLGDPLGELDRARVGVAPVGVEVELLDLRGGGLRVARPGRGRRCSRRAR